MFNRLGIREKILSMLILPLLAVLGFAGVIMTERWQIWGDMSDLGELATMSPVIGNMVHELQIERGLSAGFIGSKGAPSFEKRLAEQRKNVDAAEIDLLSVLDQLDSGDLHATFHDDVELAHGQIGDLGNKRRDVTNQQLTVGEMARYYTGTIANLLSLIELANTLTTDSESSRSMTGYVALLQAKERAGLERAMGANGFGKGAFAPVIHRRFIDLIGQQNAFIDIFRSHANTDQVSLFNDRLAGPVSDEVDRMRKIAIGSLTDGDLGGVSGPQWFDAITKKINQLHDVELQLAEDLVVHADEQVTASSSTVLVNGVLIVLAFSLTIAFGIYNCLRLIQPIKSIRACVGELAMGKMKSAISRAHWIKSISAALRRHGSAPHWMPAKPWSWWPTGVLKLSLRTLPSWQRFRPTKQLSSKKFHSSAPSRSLAQKSRCSSKA